MFVQLILSVYKYKSIIIYKLCNFSRLDIVLFVKSSLCILCDPVRVLSWRTLERELSLLFK